MKRTVHKHSFLSALPLISGCVTTATKLWTQTAFKISFPEMTRDSLSAVKLNPFMEHIMLHCWEIKSINRAFEVHVHIHMHTCLKRQQRQVYYQICFGASRWTCLVLFSHSVERNHTQNTSSYKISSTPSFYFSEARHFDDIQNLYTQKRQYPLKPFHLLYTWLFPSLMCWLPALSRKSSKRSRKALDYCL